MDTMTIETMRPVVAKTVAWLDDNWNTEEIGVEWFDAINPRLLRMHSVCLCAAGQLGLAIAYRYDFELDDGSARDSEYVRNGFALLIGVYDHLDYDNSNLDRDLSMQMIGYVEKVLGHRQVPNHLCMAFTGDTPASLWIGEIERRRAERKP